MTLDPLLTQRCIEALLFAAAEPLSVEDLAKRLPEGADIGAGLADLHARYVGRGIELVQVAGRWRFQTAIDLAFLMTEEREEPRRLSKAAQEERGGRRARFKGEGKRHTGKPCGELDAARARRGTDEDRGRAARG